MSTDTVTPRPNRLAVLREDPKTGRVGTNWTPEEDTLLLGQVKDGLDYDQIALEHQRTSNSVKTRVVEIYLKKIANNELTLEEASIAVRLPAPMFTAAKRRRELRQERRKAPKEQQHDVVTTPAPTPSDDIFALLKEINGKLDQIINACAKQT